MKPAPAFLLLDQHSKERTLQDYSGKWLVLYFYPKDDTPGCTTEACSFRDERAVIQEFGHAEVVGISKDSPASHKKFTDKYTLNFTLLSDPDHVIMDAYGAWGERKFMGRTFQGVLRNTYLINPAGYIVKEYLGVDPKTHATEIIKDLQNLQSK